MEPAENMGLAYFNVLRGPKVLADGTSGRLTEGKNAAHGIKEGWLDVY
jgi:hypothetical protein